MQSLVQPDLSNVAEEWRPVPGYEGVYDVSSLGRVRRLQQYRQRTPDGVLKRYVAPSGYVRVTLSRNDRTCQFGVHQLVAAAFLGPRPDGLMVNHIDGVKTNNEPSNLEYVTSAENNRHAFRAGLNSCGGQDNASAKLTQGTVDAMRRALVEGASLAGVRRQFAQISKTELLDILRGRVWHTGDATLREQCAAIYPMRAAAAQCKLSAEDVAEIRRLLGTKPKTQIAKQFGVSDTAIRFIELGRNHGARGYHATHLLELGVVRVVDNVVCPVTGKTVRRVGLAQQATDNVGRAAKGER